MNEKNEEEINENKETQRRCGEEGEEVMVFKGGGGRLGFVVVPLQCWVSLYALEIFF